MNDDSQQVILGIILVFVIGFILIKIQDKTPRAQPKQPITQRDRDLRALHEAGKNYEKQR